MKYQDIDEREIKSCDTKENTRESGISFDYTEEGTPVLRFHYLEFIGVVLDQKTRTMHLDKENTKQLIKALKYLTWPK